MITGQIFINQRDHFQVDTVELDNGDLLEVLVVDGMNGQTRWIPAAVEHNGESYYLTGLLGYSPIGLFAKVER